MQISLKQLVYFIAVAESGSISKALTSLNVTQSVVTEAIKKLEDTLGAELFTRHARGMILTHAGHQFLRHAHEVLAALRNAEQAIRERPDATTGQLNLGVTSLVTAYYLPYLLDRFERVFPGIQVTIVEDRRGYIEHLLINGELDVAVMNVSAVDKQAIETRTLLRAPWRVWLASNHPLVQREAVALQELQTERFLSLRNDELEEISQQIYRLSGSPPVAVRTDSIEAVRSLVALGIGVAVLPNLMYRPWSLEGDRLESRPLQENLPRLEIGVAWRRGSALSEAARQFLVVVGEHSRVQEYGMNYAELPSPSE
ncbi:MAG: LysR family transcriptional regulator [Meiothermus sp.]|uniref:LysR family transcriptional regulator n=1 Tax=Meiothermus sp. TaxID=1955249 RepID=UPI0025F28118|nr:LysR family transcriptional regulator [Meiothermus sp.]MCS7068030.1 LysR family transcriptional regulator [Meiothermus sp.]MCX7600694.1 LysR family transcriptional regulator [Meiothermus sp.]MDW8425949.1 LysR family transcriptional regulator [Meiothermus sp.]